MSQNFKLDSNQLEAVSIAIEKLKAKQPLIRIAGGAGCYDSETEYLSDTGWKKFTQYSEGESVGQYNPLTDSVEFVTPSEYIKLPETVFYEVNTKHLSMSLTEGHRVVYWPTRSSKPKVITWKEAIEKQVKSKQGWRGNIKTTFNFSGEGIDFTEGELRLQVAVMADGRIVKEGKDNYTQMRFGKKRKYDRLLKICKDFKLRYLDNGAKPNNKYQSGLEYEVIVWPKTGDKKFDPKYWRCSKEQLEIIADEVPNWDGSIIKRKSGTAFRYFTKNKTDADFVQFCFATVGRRAGIHVDARAETPDYTVNVNIGHKFLTICSYPKKPEIRRSASDGFKYCFTVPSSMLVVRRKDKIFISGNTGKTTILKEIVKAFPNIGPCAYTGKASSVLRKKGVEDSTTIHAKIYQWNERRKRFYRVPDVPYKGFLVDEASMVGKVIFRDLQSYTIPILAIGDPYQLEPIGSDINLMTDSDYELKKVYRQGEGSEILDLATRVRTGDKWGVQRQKSCHVYSGRPQFRDIRNADIVICGFNKTRVAVNTLFRKDKNFKDLLHVGDRLIIRNNDKDLGIYNGQTLVVEEILSEKSNYIEIKGLFDCGLERIIKVSKKGFNCLKKHKWDDLKPEIGFSAYCDYSYAITCHSAQGSEYDNVAVISEQCKLWDQTRWDYTAITRAAKGLKLWLG